jgi:hypothetical protein
MRFARDFLLCAAFFALSVVAQSPNGTINGQVLDPSGGAIADAGIVIVNDVTGSQYITKTNDEGIYVLVNLPPGPYRLQVSKVGFKTLIKPDIILNVQDALAISFTLPIGALAQTVTVEGGALPDPRYGHPGRSSYRRLGAKARARRRKGRIGCLHGCTS